MQLPSLVMKTVRPPGISATTLTGCDVSSIEVELVRHGVNIMKHLAQVAAEGTKMTLQDYSSRTERR